MPKGFPKTNPRTTPIDMPNIPRRYPRGRDIKRSNTGQVISDEAVKYLSQVPSVNTPGDPSETTIRHSTHVRKEFPGKNSEK